MLILPTKDIYRSTVFDYIMGKKYPNKNIPVNKTTEAENHKSRKTTLVSDKKVTKKTKEVSEDMKFLKLAEASPSAILIYDMQGVHYVNKAASDLTGYSIKDLLKMKFWDLINPDDIEGVKTRGAARLSGEKMLKRYQFRILTKKKEIKWIEFAANLIEYEGRPCAVGIALDITEKTETEMNEAFQSNQRIFFQSVLLKLSKLNNLELSEIFKILTKEIAEALKTERVSLWHFIENDTLLHCEVLYLLSKNSFASEEDLQTELYPEYINALADNLYITADNAFENPYTKVFSKSYLLPNNIFSMIDVPVRIQGKVVGTVCVEHTGNQRKWTAEEQFFVTSVADIMSLYMEADERKKAENSLKKAHVEINKAFRKLKERKEIIEVEREKLEITLKSIGDGVITTDFEGRVLFMNKTAEELTGWKQAEVFGRHIDEIFVINNETTNEPISSPIEEVLKTGEIVELANHTVLLSKSGEKRIICDSAAPIRDGQGNIFGAILVFRDTTAQKLAADQLMENEEVYRTLFEAANDANFILQDGLFIECNKKAEIIFNCGKEHIIGKPPFAYSPEYQPDGRLSAVAAKEKIDLALEGKPQSFYWKHTHFDGSEFDAEVNLNKIFVQGKPYVQAIVRDITKRKQAKEKLVESENLLRNIIETANIAMAIVSFDGTIEYINNQAVKTFGYEHEDIPTMDKWWVLAYPEENYRKQVVDQYMGLVYKAIEGNKEIERREYFSTCKDGSIKTMIIFGVIVNDKVFVMFEDITDRKKSEEAILRSEERYRTLVELSPNPIIVHTDGIIEYANEASLKAFGAITKDELIGKNALEFVHPDDRKLALERIKFSLLNKSEAPLMEERFVRFDGSIMFVEVTAVPFDNMGRNSMFTMFKDVTEKKLAEENLYMYKFILENTTEEFYLVNPDGSFSYFNEAAAKSLGYSMAEFKRLGIPDIDVIHNTKEKFRKHFEQLKTTTLPAFETIHRAKNGNLLTKFIKSFYLEIGGQGYACGFGHDISESKKMSEAIKESEEKYRSLIETTDTGFVIINEHGTVLDANAKYVSLTGCNSLDEILNHSVIEWTVESAKKSNSEAIKKCLIQGFIRNLEIDYIHKDGTIVPVEISATVEKSEAGITILSLVHDISKRKEAEAALIKSQQLFQTLAEVAPVGVFRARADGYTTYVNPKWCELSGLQFEKALGDGWLNAIHPEDREKIKNTWKQATIKKSKSLTEYRFLKKDGSIVCVIGNAVPEYNNGEVVGYIGTITDITDRIKSEQYLKESEEKYRSLIETTDTGFVILNEQGIVFDANSEYVSLTGYNSLDEIINHNVIEWTADHAKTSNKEAIKNCVNQGFIRNFETDYIHKDGTIIPVEVSATVEKSEAGITILSLVHNITKRKQAEEALKESEKLYRTTFETTGTATVLVEEDTTIIYANAEFEKLSGYSKHDIEGKKHWTEFVCKEDLDRMKIQHALRREKREAALKQYEFRFINKEGDIRNIFLSIDLIPDTKKSVASLLDITERKRDEEILKESEEKFRSTFDQSPVGSALVGLDKRFIRCNNAFCRFLGYSENELIGKTVADITYPEDIEIGMDIMKEMTEGRRKTKSSTFHKRYLRKDGNIVWGEISISVIQDINNKPLYLLPIIQDINERKKAEESLKESEEKFRLLFTSTSQAVTLNEIILDKKGNPVNYRILEANPAFEEHTGLKSKDFIGKLVLDVLPQTEAYWMKEFGEVALTGKPKRLENYVKELNRYFDFTVYSPKKGQFALISTDITQRKRQEEVKKLNEARLEALIKLNNMAEKPFDQITEFSLEEGVKLTGSKIGYLAFTNEDESTFTMHAFSIAAMEQCAIKEKTFMYSTDKTAFVGGVIRQRKAIMCNDYRNSKIQKNGYPEGHVEIKNFMSIPIFDGAHIVAIAAVSNKDRDYDDADVMQLTLLMNGMYRLIQRKKDNEILKESEERYRLIADNSKDIIAKFGIDGKFSFISPACKDLLGFEISEILNKSVFDFFHPDDIPAMRIYQQRLLLQKAPNLVKHRLRKADGTYMWFETNNQIVQESDGSIREIVAITRDITELLNSEKLIKDKEAAELASKAKSEFLANMSHEIRNPLNSIIGLSNALSRSELDAKHSEIVESIKTSSNNLLNILNGILDFSKIEANKVEVNNNVFDLEVVVKGVYSSYKTLAEQKNLDISYQLNKNVPPILFGDSGKLKQMINNLVGNAIKFTEEGSVNILVSLARTEGELSFLKIEVSDTGIGIKKEDYDRLFQSFTQLDSSTTKSFSGTGLGLAIVKRYAQLMKGNVSFVSEFGKGSTFIIEIPFVIPKGHQEEIKQKPKDMDFSKHQVRLLLAEDDGINQLYLKGLLTGHGILVDTAYNGLQALEKFDINTYDIILMDGQMPKMDGFEATRSIRQREETKNTHTPIIAITGYAVSGDKEKFLASGMDDYVSKPIDENRLIELIHQYVIKNQEE